jgi:hypothetical protein
MSEFDQTPLERRKEQKEVLKWGAGCSTLIGVIIILSFLCKVVNSHSLPREGEIDLQGFGTFGDFVGGFVGTVFSLTGIFLLYLTLKEQRENFDRERLESNFFEMIKFHKENVAELEFTYHESQLENSKVKAVKRKVFKVIFSHFGTLWSELGFLFDDVSEKDIYKADQLLKLKENKTLIGRDVDLKELAKIDITYLIIFFGLSKSDKKTILSITSKIYNPEFAENILKVASLKPKRNSANWNKWYRIINIEDSVIKKKVLIDFFKQRDNTYSYNQETFLYFNEQMGSSYYEDNYDKFYGGHQFRLGHYYRHIFQNLEYINGQPYLTYNEKYFYVKLLRTQLSNYEQIIMFLNSVSQVGRVIEISQPDLNNQLITKYNLIKNIPDNLLFNTINILNYYPNVEFEIFNNSKINREKIEALFK